MRVTSPRSALPAYTVPFVTFVAILALDGAISYFSKAGSPWWIATPKYWLYPLQTLVCGLLLAIFWKHYTFKPLRPWALGAAAGVVALALWVSPQAILHFPPRLDGFNPAVFGNVGWPYEANLGSRLIRLIVVVPLLEEIFWRGFLMRYLIRDDFLSVPFGTYRPGAFFGTAAFFMLVHSYPDWPAALVTGLIYNAVAVRTKSLFACVIAHAVTNAGLGIYILATWQWGFW